MPCSLSSPSPSPSFESIKLEDSGAQAEPESTQPDLQPVVHISSQPSIISIPSLQPLARSMSMEQRESFLSGLNTLSAATAHTIPREVIHSACFEAVKLGFHARIVVGNTNDPEARLVLGRNEAAVKRLCDELESEQKNPQGGNFRAVAGGAVVGAVGAIAGLAFS
ncbi:hypothetical protein H0H93_001366 [Arthromyces matolae]|nr:hypothetical protein H0H93_001366 [Arthromyces matolae]